MWIRLGEISIGVQLWAAGVVQGTVPVNEAHSVGLRVASSVMVRVKGSVWVSVLVEVQVWGPVLVKLFVSIAIKEL